jgi:putative nucleotidyltransferase with HDIG domain
MTTTPTPEALEHAARLRHLDDVIRHIKDLPTLPAVALEMSTDLDEDHASLDSIVEKVSMDHSLTAKILRIANSSQYGTNSRVVTLQQAVSMLGLKNIKNLMRMTIMVQAFPPSKCPDFDFTSFWRHSVSTALCAEIISRTLHMKHDFAFTAGLLHDIGRLVLATRFPDEYAQVIRYRAEQDCYWLDAERHVMGIDHVIAGHALAEHWRFSEVITDAIQAHHEPHLKSANALARIVHVADAITHALDLSHAEDDLVPVLSQAAWDNLGLKESDYLAIFHETEMRFEAYDQLVA